LDDGFLKAATRECEVSQKFEHIKKV